MKLKPISNDFTIKEHLYGVLRDHILGIDIYGSDEDLRLDERQLAAQLGVSRTPIREVLARLAQDGLVEIIPRKGVFIHRKTTGYEAAIFAALPASVLAWRMPPTGRVSPDT